MRPFSLILASAVLFLSIAPAQADLGDQLFKLLANDGAEYERFGGSVAISGTTAIVGASFDNGFDFGSAYLFDTITGAQIAKLLPNDGAACDVFGYSVAISGTTAIVAAPWDDDNGTNAGSAYLFDTITGRQIAKLLPDDGNSTDVFGISVSISGTIAIVGVPWDDDNGTNAGSAYLFDTITGRQIAKLLPDHSSEHDYFGYRVAVSGTIIVIGAPWDDDNGDASGSAYFFDIITGRQIAKLLPNDGAEDDNFGYSVAISGATAIVGARDHDDNGSDSGSAYLFNTSTCQQIAKLLPSDGAEGDQFGFSVAISGATAIVGAYQDEDNGQWSGSAYLFDTATGQQIAKLLPDDGAWPDQFGYSVAISGPTAIIGARYDDDNGDLSGSAYLFDAAVASDCPEDSDGDGMVTICHIPPAHPDNAHTITVSVNALPAHLAHGDHCGPCEEDGGLLMSSGGGAGHDPCPTDLDDSGDVGAADLAEIIGAWGAKTGHSADLDGDGAVGPLDLALVLGNWGPCE